MPSRLATPALALALAITGLCRTASADDAPVPANVPDARLVGEGRLKVLLWNVYDVRLYAPGGRLDRDAPFALAFSYLRPVDGTDIVEASIDEMAARSDHDPATLARWRTTLERIVPDVDKGTTLVGVRDALGHTRFFRDGDALGEVRDPAFTRAFFDIWLGETTSRPALRDDLLSRTER